MATPASPGVGRRGQGISAHPDHAGKHEPGTSRPASRLWRGTGTHPGWKACLGRCAEPSRSSPRRRMPGCRSNFRTRPTGGPPADHCRRALGRHRWQIDILVGGIGTGGTITGAGQVLKQLKPDIQVVAVEPAESPLLATGEAGRTRSRASGPISSRTCSTARSTMRSSTSMPRRPLPPHTS